MYKFRMKIAGIVLEVETIHTRSKAICRHFETTESPSMHLTVFQTDIDRLTKIIIEHNPQNYDPWDGLTEVSVLLIKICEEFLDFDLLMTHGAAISDGKNAYLFTAQSGTGKTTHILKWLDHLPDAFVVNGDKPFIKIPEDGGNPLACGSPWAGKEHLYTNTMVPLKSIILMERAEDNHIEQISFAEAFPALLQQVYRPDDPVKMRKTLQLMQRLNHTVTFWRFQCNNFKDDCFQVAYSALHG